LSSDLIATSVGNGGNRVYADAANAICEDNIWVFIVPAEKSVNFNSRARVRLFLGADAQHALG